MRVIDNDDEKKQEVYCRDRVMHNGKSGCWLLKSVWGGIMLTA